MGLGVGLGLGLGLGLAPPNSMKKVPEAATTTAHTKERQVIDADQCEQTSSNE